MLKLRKCGADPLAGGATRFTVWAPNARSMEVRIIDGPTLTMEEDESGFFEVVAPHCGPGSRYLYRIDGKVERPDPASRLQPSGVHGPSEVVSDDFAWSDQEWRGHPLEDYVIYELHVGTFSAQGTFDGVIPQLDRLRDLGITAIELMPVAQFPGERNWGYDGVYPYAVQKSYGGPEGLRRLVDACHGRGLSLILDVVYNHLGPEGNYLGEFGPFFTDRYKTPWGGAMNFDGPHSDGVRNFFLGNAAQWIEQFHVDALRLDAVHAIVDQTARPFLQELAEVVHERGEAAGRKAFVIAESDLNDPRMIRPVERGGIGMDAQWADDLHHALHSVLTGESNGYYCDYGKVEHLKQIAEQGYLFTGQYSTFRRRRYGAPTDGLGGSKFVVCAQNHDQIGNRMAGDRLAASLTPAQQKLALATVLLSPFVPMLFMGEEYGETAPFQYFTSHSDPDLIEAVRKGRREEFSSFAWSGDVPDPHAEETFQRCRLTDKRSAEQEELHSFVSELIALRRRFAALRERSLESVRALSWEEPPLLFVSRRSPEEELVTLLHFGEQRVTTEIPLPEGNWQRVLASVDDLADTLQSDGQATLELPGNAFVLYRREDAG